MRLLTWIPSDLRDELVKLDPANHGYTSIGRESAHDVIRRAQSTCNTIDVQSPVSPVPGRRPYLAMSATIVAIAVVAGVLVQNGRHTEIERANGNPTRILTGGSAQWSDFPVSRLPRPIVLTGPDVADPAGGFAQGETKDAYLSGHIDFAVPVPSGVGHADGYSLLNASEAVDHMRVLGSGAPSTSLHVTDMRLDSHEFETDRGPSSLPAWRITFADVEKPAYVLAVAASDRYPATLDRPTPVGTTWPVTVTANGLRLTIWFFDHQPAGGVGGCGSRGYTNILSITQTRTAIVLDVSAKADPATQTPSPSPSVICTLPLGRPPVSTPHYVTLDEPLGSRVVITRDGAPYAVMLR